MASGVQIEKWFKEGFELYKTSAGILIPASLVAFIIGSFTLGILAGPMLAGLMMMGLRLHDRSQPVPEIGDLFKGFDHFKAAFLLTLIAFVAALAASFVLSWIPVIGQLVAYVFFALLSLVLWLAIALVVDKGVDFWPAAQQAMDKVKADFWPFLAFGVLVSFVGSLGGVLCVIGICLTMPLHVCALTIAYRDTWGGGEDGTVPEPLPGAEDAVSTPPPEGTDDSASAEPEAAPGQDEESEEKPPEAG